MEIYLIGSLVALILASCYVFFQWYSGQNVTAADIFSAILCAVISWIGVILFGLILIVVICEILTSIFKRKVIIKGRNND